MRFSGGREVFSTGLATSPGRTNAVATEEGKSVLYTTFTVATRDEGIWITGPLKPFSVQ